MCLDVLTMDIKTYVLCTWGLQIQTPSMVEEDNQKFLLTMGVVENLPEDILFGQRLLVRESF